MKKLMIGFEGPISPVIQSIAYLLPEILPWRSTRKSVKKGKEGKTTHLLSGLSGSHLEAKVQGL